MLVVSNIWCTCGVLCLSLVGGSYGLYFHFNLSYFFVIESMKYLFDLFYFIKIGLNQRPIKVNMYFNRSLNKFFPFR